MKILRCICSFFLAVSLCIFLNAEAFAKSIRIDVAGKAVNGVSTGNKSIIDEEALNIISSIFKNKIQTMHKNGKLKFEPFFVADEQELFGGDKTAEDYIVLIPLILDDSCYRSTHIVGGKKVVKAIVNTHIDVLFCLYPGSGNNLRLLYNFPLAGYQTIGANGEYSTEEEINIQLKAAFIYNAETLINNNLDLNNRKLLKAIVTKQLDEETYRVENFEKSEEAGQFYEKFKGQGFISKSDEDSLDALVVNNFTSAFAATHPDLVVLPSKVNSKWEEDATQVSSTLHLDNAGRYTVDVPEPAHKISLELSKIALFENVPLSNGMENNYKCDAIAGKLMRYIDGGNKAEVKDYVHMIAPKTNNMSKNGVQYNADGMLAQLYTNLTSQLAKF